VGENAVALHAARQRYAQGAADFLNVVSTQADLLRAEDDLAESKTEVETDLVALYRALGGGWPMGGS
jgi:outer membrane protein TolC